MKSLFVTSHWLVFLFKNKMNSETPLILLVNKPRGISSFGVIRELRKRLGVRKMGHAGTLDPLAEGLLIVGVGPGTKKLTDLVSLDKVYEVEIELGERTASGDKEGEVLEERMVTLEDVPEDKLENTLSELEGEVELPVPIYSAVKKGGTPLYKRARRGEGVEAPRRLMKIYSLEVLDKREGQSRVFLSVRMRVGSGVYVRSVAEEIGRKLGLPATVSKLVRTEVGDFLLKNAVDLDSF